MGKEAKLRFIQVLAFTLVASPIFENYKRKYIPKALISPLKLSLALVIIVFGYHIDLF